ncbi:ISNCY family transposase [soil metagenome]
MKETVTLTQAEQTRVLILNRILQGHLTAADAAELLSLSVRQVRRLLASYREDGVAAIAHGNRGRTPAHTLPPTVRQHIITLAQTRYAGCNDQHLTELLAEHEGLHLSRSSLRRILRSVGLRSPRTRRAPKHRQRRERKAQPGMLVQIDGSPHRWLEARAPRCSLMAAIDDATSQVVAAVFREHEDSHGYFLLLQQLVTSQGCPVAVYHDRHSIFRPVSGKETLDEHLAGQRTLTQFGRLLTELGISSVVARSPQAKGRVERLFGTFQDRLVTELRLAGVTSLAAANTFLETFLPRYNARFAVPARDSSSAYRPLDPARDLQQLFAFTYARIVAADNTIQFGQQQLQIQPDRQRTSYTRATVSVQERLDGSLAIVYQGRTLLTQPAPLDTEAHTTLLQDSPSPVVERTEVPPPTATPRSRPAPDHPWRTPRRTSLVS